MAGGRRKGPARREPTFEPASESPPARAPKKKSTSRKRKRSGGGFSFGRFVYWSFVLALWVVIAAIGGAVWTGALLPTIQALATTRPPPLFQRVGSEGRVLAARGDGSGAALSL